MPDTWDSFVDADRARQRGEASEAQRLYEAIVDVRPDSGYAHLRLGQLAEASNDAERARAAFQAAADIGHPAAMFEYARLLARTGESSRAAEWVERAAEAGFHDVHRFESDPDLAPLRASAGGPAFEDRVRRSMQPARYSEPARQFDFWAGEWEVRTEDGRLVGHNRIEVQLNGALLVENWQSIAGWRGMSFNFYNAAASRWEQLWIDDSGEAIHFLDGRYEGTEMRFAIDASKSRRLSFTQLADGRVRQLGEHRETDGAWQVEYDLYYSR
jgi:TPR repeat protein